MGWNGTLCFGYSNDTYSFDAMLADVESTSTSDFDETVELLRKAANDYCANEVAAGIDMPWDYNWGDVFNRIPHDFFEQYGLKVRFAASEVLDHDEIVVERLELDPETGEVE